MDTKHPEIGRESGLPDHWLPDQEVSPRAWDKKGIRHVIQSVLASSVFLTSGPSAPDTPHL